MIAHRSLIKNGSVIQNYRILSVLGRGGFGITYLAEDLDYNLKVAIKEYYPRGFANRDGTLTVRPSGSKDEIEIFRWGLQKFVEEAMVLAKLKHPNIVAVKRYFKSNGTAYLVMEFCDGRSLDEIIKLEGQLQANYINKILNPILSGLEHVHKNGLLHRDIKPSNIFIRNDGNPVLLDFGSALSEIGKYKNIQMNQATDGYSPPEQYDTKVAQGPWTDIYSLAATLYKGLSGETPQMSLERLQFDRVKPISNFRIANLNPKILHAIDISMSLDYSKRPKNIKYFRSMLQVNNEIQMQKSHGKRSEVAPGKADKSESKSGKIINLQTYIFLFLAVAIFILITTFFLSSSRSSDIAFENKLPVPIKLEDSDLSDVDVAASKLYDILGRDTVFTTDSKLKANSESYKLNQQISNSIIEIFKNAPNPDLDNKMVIRNYQFENIKSINFNGSLEKNNCDKQPIINVIKCSSNGDQLLCKFSDEDKNAVSYCLSSYSKN